MLSRDVDGGYSELMSDVPETICIIEPDAKTRAHLHALLSGSYENVRAFPSAEVFFEKADRHNLGCLIADARLPGMSGFELLRALAKRINTIIVADDGSVPMAVSAMRAGAVDFIEKPFAKHALLDSVRAALARRLDR